MRVELELSTSWLFSEERYEHIRDLALRDRIALITENICYPETFKKLSKLLTDNNIPVDTLYVSNIAYYMKKNSERSSYLQTIQALSNSDTILIATEPNEILKQKCNSMKNIRKIDLYEWFFASTHLGENNSFFSQQNQSTPPSNKDDKETRCCIS